MSTYYILEVLRAEDVVWASSSRAKPPNLYVKVTLGGTVEKTRTIKRSIGPSWDAMLTLPTSGRSDVDEVTVKLKRESPLPWNRSIGSAVVKIEELLAESANGEVKVELHAPDRRRSSAVVGSLFLRLKSVDERQAIQHMVNTAQAGTEKLLNSRVAEASERLEQVQNPIQENWDLVQSVVELADQVDGFVKIMDKVATIHPYLNVTWQVVSSLQKAIKGQTNDDNEVVELVRLMKETFSTIRGLEFLSIKLKNLDDNMIDFLKQSSECCTFIREYTGHGFIGRMLKAGTHDKIQQFKGRFNELKTALIEGTILHTVFISARVTETVDLTYLQQRLNPAEMDASIRPQCLSGTRADILKDIMNWVFSDVNTNMLWLYGVAGSGKSTVSTTIAKYCFDLNRQGAHMFFLRGKSKPNSVIREIAFRLASFDQSIADHVIAAVKSNGGINEAPLESQFKKLLLQPLRSAADAMTGPVAIILDALDECGSPDERTRLMKLFREEFPKLPNVFRFIVTSRPEADLTEAFSASQSVTVVPLDYTSKASKDDVSRYLDVEMRIILRGRQQHWENTMEILNKVADGLFIWASTAIKMVKQSDEPVEELQDLVDFCRSRRTGSQSGLVELYDAVLENSGIQWHKPRSRQRFAQIVGLILFSKAPVTLGTIDGLLGCSSLNILSRLASVLDYSPGNPDLPVRLFHTSFSDYILSPERGSKYWCIDEVSVRSLLATRCFDVMAGKLCFNICRLESSLVSNDDVRGLEARVKERIPSDLQYACHYWAQHVCDVPDHQASSKLLEQLPTFVRQHLLFWFEVLSLTKHFDRVANRALYDVSLWAGPKWPDISSLLWSTFRFSSMFSHPMSRSAPHVYLSALSLGMQDFSVIEQYAKNLPIIRSNRFGTKPLQPCLKVIHGHERFVRSVAFSPDGRRIASGSGDSTIRVWDVNSGNLISGPFKDHSGKVASIVFSPDGRRIASGSYDKTIRIWDVDSGKVISGPFEGHSDIVWSVAFSPDGHRIASGSSDCTVLIWDVDSGQVVSGPFEGHSDIVSSVVFSPDGHRIASGSGDCTVLIWDVDSGKVISGPFEGHSDAVWSITFSPDGHQIASGSEDKTIRIWDVDSGKIVSGPFEGHSLGVWSVAFSPDGCRLASGSGDSTIRVWDVDSGKVVSGPFEHSDIVWSVAFSPDGRRIASGSYDMTIRIWDVDSGKVASGTFKGHLGSVSKVVFSPDGRRIASGSSDSTVIIWDVVSGKVVSGPSEGHSGSVWTVVFSPDGRRIASGSYDKTIRVWDVDSGEVISGPFEGHSGSVWSVAFSPEGRRIASASDDGTIRIWDMDSGKVISYPFEGHSSSVVSVAFSPDGRRIAYGSEDKTIRILDVDSGNLVSSPFEGHSSSVVSVAFSPDGRRIASGADNGKMHIWDVGSGNLVSSPFEHHSGSVWSVVFSPDGRRLASGTDDGAIRIWDVDSGEIVSGPFEGHSGTVWSVAFSPDGRRIVSGTDDGAIRIWDVESDKVVSRAFEDDSGSGWSVAFYPDAPWLGSGSSDGTSHVFNVAHASITTVEEEESNVQIVKKSSFSSQESQPERQEKSLVQEICGRHSWIMSEDGWLLGENGELIIWIPEDMRRTLWHPSTTSILGCPFSTKLDFTDAKLGEGWSDGYPRTSSE